MRRLLAGLAIRSRLNFATSASNSSPLVNFTPWRSLNSQVVGLISLYEVASQGVIFRSLSRTSSVS